jgi:hypothetical protein
MSDFDGVDFFENAEQMESKGPEVAPTGEYEAKIMLLRNINLTAVIGPRR